MQTLFQCLEAVPKFVVGVLSFLLVLFLGVVDYVTGPDLSVFIFYLIPVFIASWYIGRKSGIIMSSLSAVAWSLADMLSSRFYSYSIIPYWNLLMELAFFLSAVSVLSILKASLKQEQRLARTDFLTGAFNSRHFSELAEAEIVRSRRYGHPFTVVYIDVDDFKLVNDIFGHNTGDELLITIVKTVRSHTRATDIIARVGGDEFIVLFPETGFDTAGVALNKIRTRLTEIMQQQKWPVTFSFGMVTFEQAPDSVDQLLKLADKKMYEGKNSGKNSVRGETYRRAQKA